MKIERARSHWNMMTLNAAPISQRVYMYIASSNTFDTFIKISGTRVANMRTGEQFQLPSTTLVNPFYGKLTLGKGEEKHIGTIPIGGLYATGKGKSRDVYLKMSNNQVCCLTCGFEVKDSTYFTMVEYLPNATLTLQ